MWRALLGLPLPLLKAGCGFLGALHAALDRRHARECAASARRCGFQDPAAIACGMYRNLWCLPWEIAWARRLSPGSLTRNIRGSVEFRNYVETHFKGRGLVTVSAHLGNWELLGQLAALLIPPMMPVYKSHRNRLVREFMLEMRRAGDQLPVPKEEGLRPLLRHLRAGGTVGLLVDQNAGPQGVDSEFLGHPCKSWDTPVRIAHGTGCPLLPVFLFRGSHGLELVWHPPLELVVDGSGRLDVAASVRKLDALLGAAVREHPDQWLWLSHRWGRGFAR